MRFSRGIKIFRLWMQSLMLILIANGGSPSFFFSKDSNIRSLFTQMALTAGFSFHSLATLSTLQVGRRLPCLSLNGMSRSEAGNRERKWLWDAWKLWRTKIMEENNILWGMVIFDIMPFYVTTWTLCILNYMIWGVVLCYVDCRLCSTQVAGASILSFRTVDRIKAVRGKERQWQGMGGADQ